MTMVWSCSVKAHTSPTRVVTRAVPIPKDITDSACLNDSILVASILSNAPTTITTKPTMVPKSPKEVHSSVKYVVRAKRIESLWIYTLYPKWREATYHKNMVTHDK